MRQYEDNPTPNGLAKFAPGLAAMASYAVLALSTPAVQAGEKVEVKGLYGDNAPQIVEQKVSETESFPGRMQWRQDVMKDVLGIQYEKSGEYSEIISDIKAGKLPQIDKPQTEYKNSEDVKARNVKELENLTKQLSQKIDARKSVSSNVVTEEKTSSTQKDLVDTKKSSKDPSNYSLSGFAGAGSEGLASDLELNYELNDNYSAVGHFSASGDAKFATLGLMYEDMLQTVYGLAGMGFDSEGESVPVVAGRYELVNGNLLTLIDARVGGETDIAEFDNGGKALVGKSFQVGKGRLNTMAGPSVANDGAGLAGRVEYLNSLKDASWSVLLQADSANESVYFGVKLGGPSKTFDQPFGVGFIDANVVELQVEEEEEKVNINRPKPQPEVSSDVSGSGTTGVEQADGGRGDRDGGDDVSTRRVKK